MHGWRWSGCGGAALAVLLALAATVSGGETRPAPGVVLFEREADNRWRYRERIPVGSLADPPTRLVMSGNGQVVASVPAAGRAGSTGATEARSAWQRPPACRRAAARRWRSR